MNIHGWFSLGLTDLTSLLSKGFSRVFSSTTIPKHQFSGTQLSLWAIFHICAITTGKTITLTVWTFVGKVIPVLFNMLSRFVIVFLQRTSVFNFMPAVTICSDFGAQKNKISVTVCTFPPSLCHNVMGQDAMILVFWMLSFNPAFSLFSFNLIKRLFSSSLLSIVRMVVSAYLRLLIFLSAILIPACDSSSPAFHVMYSAYKLNKQGDNI